MAPAPTDSTTLSRTAEILQKVHQQLASRRPGDAVPAGLIAHRLRISHTAVLEALAELADRNVVEHLPKGPHGPAYYMPRTAIAPARHRAEHGRSTHVR
ncbi:hypothetical protein [Streptomyces sp. NBC_01237]|uniref:hypothetical protein n=1 Tax=Streptomyces sp. NBC_01237 TaxID=2903790 RepID=UPI002DDA3A6F|nr:hypothetical protein [Streptomyces sp. NBC_01237]WRZ77202.1 hypothetical protein OG251_36675 [Streptomyces sp. NBC_01237]